ncbi:MAG: hypothetical protein RLZZ488_2174 [Pseudomonadota bacterium]|jgi:hypothetical protein
MAKIFGLNGNRPLLPPNLVAFLTGVLLALVVGMIFRKVIDKMAPHRRQTALRAQATPAAPDIKSDAQNTPTKVPEAENVAISAPSEGKTDDKANSDSAIKRAPTATAALEDEDVQLSPIGEVDYLAWRRLFRTVEEMTVRQGIKISSVTLTPRYRHQAKGLAITRGQFLDVVSRKVPANLPTRQSNQGLVLHALAPADFDTQQFNKIVSDSGTRLEALCRPDKSSIPSEGVERITILASNNQSNFKCLQDWLAANPNLQRVSELSFVGFTRGPTFFGSMTSDKKLISLQMWNPDWLVDNTVAVDETGRETLIQKRTLRLANVTRALGQPSDVRMQIPASTRSLVGPLIEPKDPTPAKPLIIGNFALVPSHMPRGALIATAYTNPGQDRSKSASVKPPGPGRARALVLATQGKKLQFMTVTRE